METVKDILERKGHAVWSVRPDDTVTHALELLATANVGALMVVSDDGALVGVYSERDFAREAVTCGAEIFGKPVAELMSTSVRTIPDTLPIDACMALMPSERLRHLPVLRDGRLVGVVSIGDVVKVAVEERDLEIEQLEHYISSSL